MNYELRHKDSILLKFSATENSNEPEIEIFWQNTELQYLLPLDLTVSEGGLSVDPDVLPARMRVSGNRNVSFVTHRKSDHCGSNNLWRFASDLSLGRTDRFPPDISYKRHDRYCGIRYHCGADHLPDDWKLDDRRNYRSDRSCCGCDRKLRKIFII